MLINTKSTVAFVGTVLLSGTAYYCANGFTNIWPLMWVAPLPLCLYALRSSFGATLFAGFFAYLAGGLADACVYSHTKLGGIGIAQDALNHALEYALLLGIFRFIAIRFQHWIAVVFFAFSWTSYEFVVSLFSNHGTGGSIAYTQVQNLPIIQIASITGIWGITFLLIFMPASVAFIWHYRRSKILTLKIGVITIAIAVLTIGFGVCRMYLPKAEEKVTVGLANFTNKDHPFVKSVVDRYDVAIASLAEQGAKVVILPEEIVYMQENTTHRILRHFCVTARKNNVYLIVGLNRKEHDATYNSAYVFSPDGKIALRYDKQHLIPFGEEIQYTPGTTLGIFHTKEFGPLGVAICKDMDFVYPALQYSQQGIGALFVPAWDFGFDRWIHGRMALMRGVEGGFSIVRAAQDGLLTISDSRGQIIAYAEQKASSDTTLLIGDVPIGSGHSPYSYLGNWFAWTGLLFLAAMFAKALMMIFRPSSQ